MPQAAEQGTCPPDEALLELMRGGLGGDALAALRGHIVGCARCCALLAALGSGAAGSTPSLPSAPAAPVPTGSRWVPPEVFDEYRLVRLLGAGAMGQVFLAHDTLLDRPVAVKFLAGEAPDEAERERFLVEAQAIARLQHPNVVGIHRVGTLQRRPYLVSEYVRGQAMDRLARPLPGPRVLAIAVGLSRGLAAAHRRGVLHRDIKPANAMMAEDGEVKLLDFGLAKLLDPTPALDAPPQPRSAPRSPVTHEGPQDPRTANTQSAPLSAANLLDPPTKLATPNPSAPRRASPALTATGALVGSPLYMAPELWLGEPATRQADVYSLGVLLYQLCAGDAPHAGLSFDALRRRVQEEDVPRLAVAAPGIDARLAAVIDRCLLRDPAGRFESGDALREALEQLAVALPAGVIPAGNPYRGLRAFEAEHRVLFFGRGAEVREILDRLRSETFVLVTGDSGVGKSSLCRAGILPAVADASFEEGRAWTPLRITPGHHPLAALAAAFAPLLGADEAVVLEGMSAAPAALGRELRRARGPAARALLFIDQLEELLTLTAPAEAAAVGALLAALVTEAPFVRLLATVRSDFLTRVAALPGLGREVQRALYLLCPLSSAGLREAITGPAEAHGFRFDPPLLVDTLVTSAAQAQGGLPLLQFALGELWSARDEGARTIPAAALEAIGGVGGALARHADGVLFGLPPAQRQAARRILGQLITAEGTRAQRTAAELLGATGADGAGQAALEALLRGRLLVVHAAEESEEGAYEIAHEALITGWETLRLWLSSDAEVRARRQRLERAALEWERQGHAQEALFTPRQLAESAALAEAGLGPREAAFINASRRRQRLRTLRLGAGLLLLLGLSGGTYQILSHAASQKIDQRVNASVAEASALRGRAHQKSDEAERLRAESFALFDGRQGEKGEEVYTRALAAGREAESLLGQAGVACETALAFAPQRADLRTLFTGILFEQAVLADPGPPGPYRQLLQRIAAYEGGEENSPSLRRLRAPARVTIETRPAGARVMLQQYEDRGGKWVLSPARALGATPVLEAEVPAGSYLLTFSATGRTEVRLALLLRRGEVLHLPVDLPRADQVPAGFVYIPAGRFLFGSADSEDVRVMVYAVQPSHDVHTAAYLIGRTEVTFANWIAYLALLPAAEQKRRTPDTADVRLSRLPDGAWQLALHPPTTNHTYVVRGDERLRYPARSRRQTQDWLRFPVVGISYEDALAYAQWLSESGRLPGARLCTEHEWERAATGADGRRFPAGERLDLDDANIDVTYGRQALAFGPDEVGAHPDGRSPYGLDDLSGNAWEWMTSVKAPGQPTFKGGSYYQGAASARLINREVTHPTHRRAANGLRLCATPQDH